MKAEEIETIKSMAFRHVLYPSASSSNQLESGDMSNVFGFDTEFEWTKPLAKSEMIELDRLRKKLRNYRGSKSTKFAAEVIASKIVGTDFDQSEYISQCKKFRGAINQPISKYIKVATMDKLLNKLEEVFPAARMEEAQELSKLVIQKFELENRLSDLGRTVISYQIAYFTDKGDVRSDVAIVNTPYLKMETLYNHIMRIYARYRPGYAPPKDVYLVCHFSQAELSTIEEMSPQNAYTHDIDMLEVSSTYITAIKYRDITFHFADTFAFFKTSLKVLGHSIGVEKVELPKEQKEHMSELLKNNPELYKKYAAVDAIICLKVYDLLMEMAKDYGVDLKNYPSASGLFLEIFRAKYLDKPLAKYKMIGTRVVFSGQRACRLASLHCYHGGRNEAYWSGIYRGPIYVYDIKSSYPSSSQIQPIPNADTKWKRLNGDGWGTYEGFGWFYFAFPKTEVYPSLPIETAQYLFFPVRGQTYCTFEEARVAVRNGGYVRLIKGWGFEPGPEEINNPLKTYMHDFFRKRQGCKNEFEKMFYKLGMNSLIGKMAQRVISTDLIAMSKDFEVPIYALDDVISPGADISKYKKIILGPGFAPEVAALVLGRARAVLSDIIFSNKPLMAVTDSVALTRKYIRNCKSLEDLKKVGSGLELKGTADCGVIFRDRFYYLFKDGEIATDNKSNLMRAVMGSGVSLSDEGVVEFDEGVRKYVLEGGALPTEVKRTRFVKFREAARKNLRWNSETGEIVTPNYENKKRRVIAQNYWTLPYDCMKDVPEILK